MKFYAILCVIAALAMLLTPALVLLEPQGADTTSPSAKNTAPETVSVFLSENESVQTMDLQEYLVGAVAAEMPVSYHPQALMAQAVACHTFLLYRKAREQRSPSPELQGADLSNLPQKHQGYLTEQARREKWGGDFEQNEKKIRDAVQSVQTEIMLYDGEPIFAAFFAISPGQTETAETAFGDPLPYLQSVACDADILSPDCVQSVVYSKEEFKECAASLGDLALDEDDGTWITDIDETDTGYVHSITLGGEPFTGAQFRDAFGLRSPVFSVAQTESGFRITTKGHGHLVGMSQYAADAMARSGADHQQILHRFYKDVTITDG